MSAIYEKLSSNRAKLTFEVPAEEFEKGMQTAYKKMVSQINVQGFRRGKAPRKVIENLYGENIFYEDAFEAVFPGVYEAAVQEHKIQPVDEPSLNVDSIGGGNPLRFSVEVDVRPDVVLGQYKGVTAPKIVPVVADEDVDKELETARERIARWTNVEGRAAEDGDRVTIDYEGSVDGVPFMGGAAEDQILQIGSNTFIPGFEPQLIGMNPGEEKDISVTFPEEYHAEDLKGKDAVFHIKMKDIKVKELPELDDDFAMDVSEFDTLDEYKSSIRSKLEKTAADEAENKLNQALIDAVLENTQIDVPRGMIKRETERLVMDLRMRMAMNGIAFDRFMQSSGMTMESLMQSQAVSALRGIRVELALEAIRIAENVEVTEEDIAVQTEKLAKESDKDVEEFKAELNENQLEYLKEITANEAALKLLRDHANYIDADEYDKLMAEKAKAAEIVAEAAENAEADGPEE